MQINRNICLIVNSEKGYVYSLFKYVNTATFGFQLLC